MSIEAMKLMVHELEYVLDCINKDKIPFDGDDFHEALRLGRQAIEQAEKQEVPYVLVERDGSGKAVISAMPSSEVLGHNGWGFPIESAERRARSEALDKMAENARELGLDYEPVQAEKQEPVAWLCERDGRSIKFVYTNEQLHELGYGNISVPPFRKVAPLYTAPQPQQAEKQEPIGYADFHISSIFDLPIGSPLYTTPPTAPVQEPVAWVNWCAATGKRSVSFECESELASQPLYFGITQITQNHYSKQTEWTGLTQQDIDIAFDDTQEGGGFNEFAKAIEQTLRRKNT